MSLVTRTTRSATKAAAAAAAHALEPQLDVAPPGSEYHSDGALSPAPEATTPRRTYSDVVASRPPSPTTSSSSHETDAREHPQLSNSAGDLLVGSIRPSSVSVKANDNDKIVNDPLSDSESQYHPDPEDEFPGQWTTVDRRGKKARKGKESRKRSWGAGWDPILDAAEQALTPKQREAIATRAKRARTRAPSEHSRGEGPSKPKDKGVDPREWGDLPDEEGIDLEQQRAAFASYEQMMQEPRGERRDNAKPTGRAPTERAHHKGTKKPREKSAPAKKKHAAKNSRPAQSRPEAQIKRKSYVGVTLGKIKKANKRRNAYPSDDSSS